MDQELLMKQIVEQVMAAMKNGTPASAPAAASNCGSKVTAANYPLAESMADQIKTPTGKDFTSLSYEKVINGNEGKFTIQVTVEGGAITDVQVIQGRENMFMTDELLQQYVDTIVNDQVVMVDGISGATLDINKLNQGMTELFADTAK